MEKRGVVFLEGVRTTLRPLDVVSDTDAFLQWINDPTVSRFLGSGTTPTTREQEIEVLKKLGSSGDRVNLGIVAKPEMRLIGSLGLFRIDWVSRTAEMGIMIGDQRYWSKGYGTDATRTFVRYALERLNLRKIYWSAIAYNKRSIACARRCGFRLEGRWRQDLFREGKYWDRVWLSIFRK